MAPTEQITFYASLTSPYAQMVHFALEEAHAKYTLYEVGSQLKSAWYQTVNPLGKLPSLTFGGPAVPPDQPSPESAKLIESLALLEFIADVFPEAKLLPTDPILRARARTFALIYQNYVADHFRDVFFAGKPAADLLLHSLERLQGALPPTGFAAGEWSIAEAAVIPFLARLWLYLDFGLGRYSDEDGETLRAALAGERFARLRQYMQDARARASFKDIWVSDVHQAELAGRFPVLQRNKTAQ